MTEAEIENELATVKAQLAALQAEHTKTRQGWLRGMKHTGVLLLVYATAIFLGVLKSHVPLESSPISVSLLVIGLFMAAIALWLLLLGTHWMADKLMKAAVR